ncbi:hypothetical protein [Maricaulis maris]|uniref:hypothetical protein n=1 Tax=Maricaulis maris TaxID=74318 RepID=UPI003B8DEA0D
MSHVSGKPGVTFYAVMFVVLFLTTVLHELTHLLTGLALGVDTFAFGLGRVSLRSPADFEWQVTLISISGPLFTLTMGLFGAWLAIGRRLAFGYDLVFVAFYQRLLAMTMSVVTGNHNDEARVSLDLGLPWWAVPSVFIAVLGTALFFSSVRLRFGFLVLFLSYVTASLGYTLLIYLDGQLPGQGLCDSIMAPFYDPAFGCAGDA